MVFENTRGATKIEPFVPFVADEELQRERRKAKELKNTAWWKQKKSSGVCHYCQKKFPPAELTMDHLIPLVRGGKSIKANLVPSCKDCNSKKKYLLPMEMEPPQGDTR